MLESNLSAHTGDGARESEAAGSALRVACCIVWKAINSPLSTVISWFRLSSH